MILSIDPGIKNFAYIIYEQPKADVDGHIIKMSIECVSDFKGTALLLKGILDDYEISLIVVEQ